MSAAGWLLRVGRMGGAELAFRARVAARDKASLLAGGWRPRKWDRKDLLPLLARSAGPLDSAAERLEARDWSGAHDALCEHFHRRVSRFPVSPHALPELADRIRRRFPDAPAEAAERADRVAAGRFTVLGYRDLSFASASSTIDWHYDPVHDRHAPRRPWWSRVRYLDPAHGDHKIVWELNRHQHFLALGRAAWLTGNDGYREVFVRQFEDWLHSNPPLAGINWASMLELSLRSLSWLWALHLFLEGPGPSARGGTPWVVDLLLALDRQLRHVEQNLSRYFSPNTHLTGEALGLYACGRALPELVSAPRWEDTGRSVLLEQIDRQILPDGGHVERSTHYHRYTLDFYLLALVIARSTEDPCADRFAQAVERLAEATRVLADGEGRLPLVGDDDGGMLFPICGRPAPDVRDSLASAAAVLGRPDLALGPTPEETMWLLGNQPAWMIATKRRSPAAASRDLAASAALPDTGYYVSRPRPCDQVLIDGGSHGFLNGGHAHADALSLTATLSGRPLLIDPGTGTYTMSPALRDRFRSSQMHNTLTLDGRSQSVPRGPFHWKSVANARTQRWVTAPLLDYFEGVQDGYLPAVHRRRVLTVPGGPVLVVDSILGDGLEHEADVHWHLDPAWVVEGVERGAVALRRASGEQAWFLAIDAEMAFHAGDEEGIGWSSPAYGRVEPAMTLRLRKRGASPLTLVTLFGEGSRAAAPVLRRLPVDAEAEASDALALELDGGGFSDLLVFGYRQPILPEPTDAARQQAMRLSGHEGRLARVRAGGIETDARLLCVRRTAEGDVSWTAVLDGRYAREVSTNTLLWASPQAPDGLVVEGSPRDRVTRS